MRPWRVLLLVAVILGGLIGAYFLMQNAPKTPRLFEGAKVLILPNTGCIVRGISPSGEFVALSCDGMSKAAIWSAGTGFVQLPALDDVLYITQFGVADNGKAWGLFRTKSAMLSRTTWFTWTKEAGLDEVRLPMGSISVLSANSGATEFTCRAMNDGERRVVRLQDDGIGYPMDGLPPELRDFRPLFATDNLQMIVGKTISEDGAKLYRLYENRADLIWEIEEKTPILSATAMSRNGRFLAAVCENEMAVWSDGKRRVIDFSALPTPAKTTGFTYPPPIAVVIAISDDGGTMLAASQASLTPVFLAEDAKPVYLLDALREEGISIRTEGFEVETAEHLSRDGRVIAGNATNSKEYRPYVLIRR